MVLSGVPVLAAAGNSDTSACDVSPASSPFAITVGASDSSDQRLQLPDGVGSNYGPCIDIFAPGENVPGASANQLTTGIKLSGSSQAVAIAAGVAALHMHARPESTPAQLRQALVSAAAVGHISENLPDDFVRLILKASNQSAETEAPSDVSAFSLPASTGNEVTPSSSGSTQSTAPPQTERAPRKTRDDRGERAHRSLQEFQDSVNAESPEVASQIPGAKRRLDYTPLLQVSGVESVPLVATSPAMFPLLPAHNSGLKKMYDVVINLSQPARSDVSILIAEAATSSVRSADLTRQGDEFSGADEADWAAPERFGGPFSATIQKGDHSIALQLPLNGSTAMASSASDSFFLTVVLSSDDDSLHNKQIPIQVRACETKHSTVVLHTLHEMSIIPLPCVVGVPRICDRKLHMRKIASAYALDL
ncbi:MAG: S8 family serine peptidase [Akkermansiaceae bacterium]|nr:S8 family serine peptidase [Akkermansiaceae bacterium]